MNLEESPCPLGCRSSDLLMFTGQDKIANLPGEFNIIKCRSCNLIRTNPRPTPDSMGFYYPDDYGPYIGTEVSDNNSEHITKFKKIIRPIVRSIFDIKQNAIPRGKPGKLLEIGCASGSFLHKMSKMGWDVEGIEFSEKAALKTRALGYQVHIGTLEDAPGTANPFDLLAGWMVFEHLHDPVGGFKKLHGMANSDAWLVLSVPNAASLEFQIFKANWYALHLPNHLYHFTPDTITKILAKSGWTVVKIHHQRNLSNLRLSLAHVCEEHSWLKAGQWLRNAGSSSAKGFYLFFPIAWLLSLFGQTGRMTIWAKPNNEQKN